MSTFSDARHDLLHLCQICSQHRFHSSLGSSGSLTISLLLSQEAGLTVEVRTILGDVANTGIASIFIACISDISLTITKLRIPH